MVRALGRMIAKNNYILSNFVAAFDQTLGMIMIFISKNYKIKRFYELWLQNLQNSLLFVKYYNNMLKCVIYAKYYFCYYIF